MMKTTERKRQYRAQLKQLIKFDAALDYWPSLPSPKQALFLTLQNKEAFFGGAAAGGKSWALLAGSLMYVNEPDYNAILFRKTFQDLSLPGALIDLSKQWLMGTRSKWNEKNHTWSFPSGATVTFGYLDRADDKYNYQSTEFHYIAFDELTQFSEDSYTYLFTRLRKQEGCDIPLRMRAASNPGGVGHDWVLRRFIAGAEDIGGYFEKRKRAYVPARIADNRHIDASYYESLDEADAVTRAQLLNGDWYIQPSGGIFKREWFDRRFADAVFDEQLISADLAFKEHAKADYTVYQLWGRRGADYYLIDMVRGQWGFPEAKRQFVLFCERHPDAYHKVIEDKAAGISLIQELKRDVPGLTAYNPGTKSKIERAQIVAPFFEARNVHLPAHATWVADFINECVSFPTGPHDDMVDAMSQALIKFQRARKRYHIGKV